MNIRRRECVHAHRGTLAKRNARSSTEEGARMLEVPCAHYLASTVAYLRGHSMTNVQDTLNAESLTNQHEQQRERDTHRKNKKGKINSKERKERWIYKIIEPK